MSSGIAQAINVVLNSDIEPWSQCRPADDFKIFSIQTESKLPIATKSLIQQSIYSWKPYRNHPLELASVPIFIDNRPSGDGLLAGDARVLQDLFEDMKIPASVLSCFLDNRIQFTVFPSRYEEVGVCLLNFRQWSVAWRWNKRDGSSKAIVLWVAGSWTEYGISDWIERFLKLLTSTDIGYDTPGLLAVLLCCRNVAESLAALDEEAFRTERRLRRLTQNGKLKHEDELGTMSAAHSWLAARCIRERERVNAAASFLEHATKDTVGSPSVSTNGDAIPAADLDALHLLTSSLSHHATKLRDESSMHLSTIYNLIAQKDQATSLAIAAASRELALQSKVDQANSLKIAESSMKIAEDTKRDSNAMRVITVVTMLYLPGTFVATCFSMGIFQWSGPASDVVSPRIWVYFLFTGLLTVLTVGGFFGWMWWEGRRLACSSLEAPTTSPVVGNTPTNTPSSTWPVGPEKLEPKVQVTPAEPQLEDENSDTEGRPLNKADNLKEFVPEDVSATGRKAPAKYPEVLLEVPTNLPIRSASPFRIGLADGMTGSSANRRARSRERSLSPPWARAVHISYSGKHDTLSRSDRSRSRRRSRSHSKSRFWPRPHVHVPALEKGTQQHKLIDRSRRAGSRLRRRRSDSSSSGASNDNRKHETDDLDTTMIPQYQNISPDIIDRDMISGRRIIEPAGDTNLQGVRPPCKPRSSRLGSAYLASGAENKRRPPLEHELDIMRAIATSREKPMTFDESREKIKIQFTGHPRSWTSSTSSAKSLDANEEVSKGRYNLDITHLSTSQPNEAQKTSDLVDHLHSSQPAAINWSGQRGPERPGLNDSLDDEASPIKRQGDNSSEHEYFPPYFPLILDRHLSSPTEFENALKGPSGLLAREFQVAQYLHLFEQNSIETTLLISKTFFEDHEYIFEGADLIEWLKQHIALKRGATRMEKAIELAQELMNEGIFEKVDNADRPGLFSTRPGAMHRFCDKNSRHGSELTEASFIRKDRVRAREIKVAVV